MRTVEVQEVPVARMRTLLVVGLIALSAVGCGDGDDGAGGDATETAPVGDGATATVPETEGGDGGEDVRTSSISANDNSFNPSALSLEVGTRFTLINGGAAPHTFTVEELGIDVEAPPGESSPEVTIEGEPGEYEFVCTYHEAQGMVGTFTIPESGD